jgi:hypothetical protein
MDKCPICDAEFTRKTFSEEVGLVEEHIDCPNRCYSYCFAYGKTEIFIGDFMTSYNCDLPEKDITDIEGAMKVLIDYYRSHKCK